MPRRIIDLSIPIENGVPADPPGSGPKINYFDHQSTVGQLTALFPGLKPEDLPDRQAWAVERLDIGTHNGTHMDAPYHYHSTMNDGEPSTTIDEIPLEWCFQPGVKLDFRKFDDGYVVTPADIDRELERINHTLKPLEILVANTAAGAHFGREDYLSRGCGFGRDATLHLLRQGVRVVGTDGWSWDAPFVHTRARYEQSRDPSIIWEAHKAGREIGYCQLEKLTNLDQLPPRGFFICCFPVKIKRASAGWTRAVAIVE